MGWLGFFDAGVVEPKPFESIEELEIIRPKGGGGTSFFPIFRYVKKHMQDHLPANIIILTDGYVLGFPKEEHGFTSYFTRRRTVPGNNPLPSAVCSQSPQSFSGDNIFCNMPWHNPIIHHPNPICHMLRFLL